MTRRNMAYLVLLMLVLIGCRSRESPDEQISSTDNSLLVDGGLITTPTFQTSSDEDTQTQTPVAVQQTTQHTSTPLPATLSLSTSEPLPIIETEQDCHIVQKSLSQGFLADGVIILEEISSDSVTNLMAITSFDIKSHPLSEAPYFLGSEVSIDSKGLLYLQGSDLPEYRDFVLISGNGSVQLSIDWDDQWESKWVVDGENIVFHHKGDKPVSDVIDLYADKKIVLTPTLPEFFSGFRDAHIAFWKIVYDPQLTRAAYMRQEKESDLPIFILWDMKNEKDLWTLDKHSVYFVPPVWSPDGTNLAVVAINQKEDNWDRFELYIVGIDGKSTKWIDIKGLYQDVVITDMKWSPDGRYLAFLAPADKPFLILDISTQRLYDYCIPGNSSYGRIIWSPDSTQIIVPQKDAPAIVIDLVNVTAAQIVDDYHFRPVGWLVEEP